MGKRGPQPKGEYGRNIGRTAVLSTRIQPDTRARLSQAARANRRSLSQELEHRLRRSFINEDRVIDFYGSQANAAIAHLLGAVIKSTCTEWLVKSGDEWVRDLHKDPGEWLRNPKVFDQVLVAIVHALMWFKPAGSHNDQLFFYSSVVERLIDEIRAADPSLPLEKGSRRQHPLAVLKDELGDLVHHRHPYDDLFKKEPVPPNPERYARWRAASSSAGSSPGVRD
jgi:hypothetical protein